MMPKIETLLKCLPPYEDVWIVVHPKQKVSDIIAEILKSHKKFAPYYDNIALYFDGDSTQEICENLYYFLKQNIKYQEEGEEDQTTSLPTGILVRRHGDCKHYSSFAGGVLDGLNRLGKSLKWSYRFASYDWLQRTPHHVFVVVEDEDTGKEIWIDPTPGASAQIPVWLIDKKINVSSMALRRNIAGFENVGLIRQETFVDQFPVSPDEVLSPVVVEQIEEQQADEQLTPELQNAIEVLLHFGVMNQSGVISDARLRELAKTLNQQEFDLVSNARLTLQVYIADAAAGGKAALGSLFSDVWRGIKKVTLALPRNAYLSLVALNAFGYATKLKNAIYNKDGTYSQPGQDKLYKLWYSFGGDWSALKNAVNSGSKKVAILGAIDLQEQKETLGAAAAALPAWVAVASALIAAITPLVREIIQTKARSGMLDPSIDPNTGLPYGVNPGDPLQYGGNGGIINWVKSHPLESIAIGAAAYFAISEITKPKSKSKTV